MRLLYAIGIVRMGFAFHVGNPWEDYISGSGPVCRVVRSGSRLTTLSREIPAGRSRDTAKFDCNSSISFSSPLNGTTVNGVEDWQLDQILIWPACLPLTRATRSQISRPGSGRDNRTQPQRKTRSGRPQETLINDKTERDMARAKTRIFQRLLGTTFVAPSPSLFSAVSNLVVGLFVNGSEPSSSQQCKVDSAGLQV